nr:RNA-dependent RNA polymerase [Solemoviridae sp.]
MISLLRHAPLRSTLRDDSPGPAMKARIHYAMAAWHERVRWSIPADFMEHSHFMRVIRRLDWTSSPGYPYMLRNSCNAHLFGAKDDTLDTEKVNHIWSIVQQRLIKRDCDPIRLFVKPEVHEKRKLDLEKYRLISSVSVVDQIIDHMLFDELNDKMVASWIHIPGKAGWSPFGGGWRFMPRETWMATDASSWDWTVQPWLLEMCLEFRARQCENLDERWLELASWRYECLYKNPLFITSGGLLLRQKAPGIMKSGCVNTISDNSLMQAILHLRVSLEIGMPTIPYLFTMGDDRLQEPIPDEFLEKYLEVTRQFCILKYAQRKNEFSGFCFEGKWIEPVHRAKHAYNLLHMDEKVVVPMAHSYVLNYHRSRYARVMEDLFHKMDVTLFPKDVRDLIFDGF